MVSRTRRFAVPWSSPARACSACVLRRAFADGGLSVTPAVLEHRAQLGTVGSYTLNNTTKETLQVTVTVRPWKQQLNGTVVTDPRANLTRYVRATRRPSRSAPARSARLLPDGAARAGRLALRQRRGFGKPTNTKGRKGIIPQYRIISSMRLNPARSRIKLKTGAAQVRSGS